MSEEQDPWWYAHLDPKDNKEACWKAFEESVTDAVAALVAKGKLPAPPHAA